MTNPYCGLLGLLYDWQTLIAGALALFAGILAYWIGKQQVQASRDAMVSSNRAFIFCERINSHWIAKKETDEIIEWAFTPIWRNSGNTPTRSAVTCINTWVGVDAGELPADCGFPDYGTPHGIIIGPSAVMEGSSLRISIARLQKMRAGEAHAYIWGWVDYSDIFIKTQRHRAEFCMEIEVSGNPIYKEGGFKYRVHGPFNGIDDDCFRPPNGNQTR